MASLDWGLIEVGQRSATDMLSVTGVAKRFTARSPAILLMLFADCTPVGRNRLPVLASAN